MILLSLFCPLHMCLSFRPPRNGVGVKVDRPFLALPLRDGLLDNLLENPAIAGRRDPVDRAEGGGDPSMQTPPIARGQLRTAEADG